MNYNLKDIPIGNAKNAFKKMGGIMRPEKKSILMAFVVMAVSTGVAMIAPYLIGYSIDHFIVKKNLNGLEVYLLILLGLYVVSGIADYWQTLLMGTVGQKMLYSLRNEIFRKLQALPVGFFNQNKSGDLIARINNDTDRVNQFFSQSLMRFAKSVFSMLGATIFLLSLNLKLGSAALGPAVLILVFALFVSPWVRKKNKTSLDVEGNLSGEIQESLSNFKTIVVFNRRNYFKEKFAKANQQNYNAAVKAGWANGVFMPSFSLFSSLAQLIVLTFGIYLISKGSFTIGLLISFLAYVDNFYRPVRQIAVLWSDLQTALAAWDRISVILNLESDLQIEPSKDLKPKHKVNTDTLLEFRDVSFKYDNNGRLILKHISFKLERGKIYALIGPTGGGKSTTANLIARLYDPTKGEVLLGDRDIRTFTEQEKTQKIGFILQEPFLFTGTLKENILFNHQDLAHISDEELLKELEEKGLSDLISKFQNGLKTQIDSNSDSLSLGQKQLVAFIRAVLRQPELLILDEATANVDTVTEQLLTQILNQLPKTTTQVVIAHRLNTIEHADEIFFVNAGEVTPAGNLDNALKMLMEEKRAS